jgi:hypothetical protein
MICPLRGTNAARVAAHAKLVAACPDGNDGDDRCATSGWSTGRRRSTTAFSTSTIAADAKYAATTSAKTTGFRRTSVTMTARVNQTIPKLPMCVSATKKVSKGSARWWTTHRSSL